jgi:hypothetical protein
MPLFLSAQKLNQKCPDPKRNNEMLIGICTRDGFTMIQSNFDSVFQAEYALYEPDKAILNELSNELKEIRIKVVMATWCGDSKDWIPRFYKILDQIGYNDKRLSLICVDREKQAPVKDLDKLSIERVPTFIFYYKNRELGRIIETPNNTLEKDMLVITQKK